jgi:hypothetical protein
MYSASGMRARASAAAGVVLIATCFGAPQAMAQSPPNGVHIDPGSPAGKQYQIPIPAARQQASGSSGTGGGTGANPPLFGVGVGSDQSGSTANGTATSATHSSRAHADKRSRHTRSGHAVQRAARSPAHPTPQPTRTYKASQVGSNSWLPLVVGGALVLVLGGGGGLGLRRRYVRR